MMNEPSQLESVEAALRSLRPVVGRVNADQVIYEAGRAAGRRTARRWQAGSGALAVMLAASLLMHASPAPGLGGGANGEGSFTIVTLDPPPAEPQVVTPRPIVVAPPSGGGAGVGIWGWGGEDDFAWQYHALRQLVLEEGIDALPQESGTSVARPAEGGDELADVKRLLERPARPAAPQQPLPWWVHLIAGEPS